MQRVLELPWSTARITGSAGMGGTVTFPGRRCGNLSLPAPAGLELRRPGPPGRLRRRHAPVIGGLHVVNALVIVGVTAQIVREPRAAGSDQPRTRAWLAS